MSEEQTEEIRPTSISQLRPKMRLEGVVRRTELYGAFIDLGLERDGMVHISQLSDRRVDKVTDVVKEGDRVTVWVTDVDPKQGRIALTMVEPPQVEWRDLKEGQVYTGRIIRMERYGVFVDIGASRPGLLHNREMGGRVVRDPSELFRVGDEVEVRITALDRQKRRIDLTMEDRIDTSSDEDEEDEEERLTALELAFRRAEKGERRPRKRSRPVETRRGVRTAQEDIFRRTLEQHGDERSL